MEFSWSAQQIELRAEARDVAADAVARFGRSNDSWINGYSKEFAKELAEHGWIGMTWPAEYGGGGRPPIDRLIVGEEMIKAGAPIAAVWFADRQMGPSLIAYGRPDQQSEFLPQILSGETTWCIGMSEPGAGSDLAALRTTATRDGDTWVLNGQKIWTSFGAVADYCYVICRTSSDGPPHEGISEIVVPMDTPGIEVRPITDMTTNRHFCEVFFTDARVPAGNLVGVEGAAFKQTMRQLEHERGGIDRLVSNYALYETALERLRAADRLDDPVVRQEIASIETGYRLGRILVIREVLRQAPAGFSAAAKCFGTEHEWRVAQFVAWVLGPEAALWDPFTQGLAYAPGYTIMGGTSNIMRNILAERVLGLPREPRLKNIIVLVIRSRTICYGRPPRRAGKPGSMLANCLEGTMTRRSIRLGGVATILLLSLTVGNVADAKPVSPDDLTATPLSVSSRAQGTKAPTSALAKTDRSLLGRTDATPVNVMIKLDYDSIATYGGTVTGLAATSPSVTGKALTGKSPAESRYTSHVAGIEKSFVSALSKRVPAAKVVNSLRVVYGGVAATVPANKIADVLTLPDVVAVQQDVKQKLLTDSSPDFIGATSLYSQLGGKPNVGKGVIFGVLDTGAWPEHPSFADNGNLGTPPPKADGTPRTCNFGDNPLTPANDPFVCSKKLIGGAPFLTTYLSNPDRAAAEPFHTARDSNGHGTHTGSTSAGNPVASAPVLGVERGPVNGIAPGAWVSVYKVCGIEGCFDSDTSAAVQQAILDGVKVINFSISGGTEPATDPTELAFLDAYAAGVFVSASAGNDGPGAGTANHLSPWTTSVAASTQTREFRSHLTVTSSDGATFEVDGASITAGAGPAPIVLSSAAPYSRALCDAPAAPGTFTGKIVACQRGVNARVEKGFNVLQGGAVGMVLYNPVQADVETDNHWLPTVHLADGTAFVAFMAAHPGLTASFTAGTKAAGQGDVMAAFSSRGPGGFVIKPDITAPGVQILAGHTPFRESILEGPPGEMFQAIAGTSMSSPHIAGSAILLRALHPTWTPGQVRSAMMTTSITDVVKEDLSTPADPFDFGAGRVDLNVADTPGLTFDETAADMAALGNSPLTAVHLNIPSIDAPVMPGHLETVRTAKNTTNKRRYYRIETSAPAGSTISVNTKNINVAAGASVDLHITIDSDGPIGEQQFGEIRLVPKNSVNPTLHLPVAFVPSQGAVSLTQTCAADEIRKDQTTTCEVTAVNNAFEETTVDLRSRVNHPLEITAADGATVTDGGRGAELLGEELSAAVVGIPSIAPGASPAGYIPLSAFGVTPIAVGDEDILNFNVPGFNFAGKTYTSLGVDSNGYIVAGGGSSEDNNCCDPVIPDPARPNGVLAPFWTDLDGTGAPGIYATVLTDGVNDWIVIEWQVNVFGTTSNRHFQVWLGVNGVEDISYAYDPAALPGDPASQPLVVGAESEDGSGGGTITGLPTEDLVVTSSDPVPGGSASYELTVKGKQKGPGLLTTRMDSDLVVGTTVVKTPITVLKKFP